MENISATCSSSPSTKLSIFLSKLTRVDSVESPIHTDASWLAYRSLIWSYLGLPVSTYAAAVMCLAHRDANLLNDSSMMSHSPSPRWIRPKARSFNAGMSYCSASSSDMRCLGHVAEVVDRDRPYRRGGKWTLGTDGGSSQQRVQQSQRPAICDSLWTQTVRILSHPYRDTTGRLGTCHNISGMLRIFAVRTHVTNAMSGTFTIFPFSTRSS